MAKISCEMVYKLQRKNFDSSYLHFVNQNIEVDTDKIQ